MKKFQLLSVTNHQELFKLYPKAKLLESKTKRIYQIKRHIFVEFQYVIVKHWFKKNTIDYNHFTFSKLFYYKNK